LGKSRYFHNRVEVFRLQNHIEAKKKQRKQAVKDMKVMGSLELIPVLLLLGGHYSFRIFNAIAILPGFIFTMYLLFAFSNWLGSRSEIADMQEVIEDLQSPEKLDAYITA
jgi:hypothetical protein